MNYQALKCDKYKSTNYYSLLIAFQRVSNGLVFNIKGAFH